MSGDIIVDKNEAFKSIYDNFDLNYAYDHSILDTIVQKELEKGLKEDDTLGERGTAPPILVYTHFSGATTYQIEEFIFNCFCSYFS